MKRIAVTGGKGGTGKSTFTILFAAKLRKEGKKVVIADLDVDCPNDHLLSGVEFANEIPADCELPEIDKEKCIQCGKCVSFCRSNALYKVRDKAPKLYADLCNSCGLCWEICPVGAIKPVKQKIGSTYQMEIVDGIQLVSGVVKTGRLDSEAVVSAAKERAEKLAKEIGADYILFDTAAGTHCTVVHALLGTEKAYVVTEPTRLGLHDSRIMLDVLDKLEIAAEFVINRTGLSGAEGIEGLAKERGVKIPYTVPFSEELALAYSSGALVREFKETWING